MTFRKSPKIAYLPEAICVAILFFLPVPAFAQEYAPPDAELWAQMGNALDNVNMSLQAHQHVQSILQNVQAEAAKRGKRPAQVSEKVREAVPDAMPTSGPGRSPEDIAKQIEDVKRMHGRQ
jgi:hypothetical protein